MEYWLKISLLLSVFGFVREIRPSEPFITDFLVKFKNLELNDVLRYVYPIGTYSYMLQAVIAFLITDYLRYKPLIFVSGLSGVIIWSLLLWTDSLLNMQLTQIFYGTYLATEVAYFTYIYAKVDREHFDRVTAHTRAAMFFGRVFGCGAAQILVHLKWMNYEDLNYITLVAQIICTFWSFLLPKVKTSVYFHRKSFDKAQIERGKYGTISQSAERRIPDHSIEDNELQRIQPLNIAETLELGTGTNTTNVLKKVDNDDDKGSDDVDIRSTFALLWHQFISSYSDIEVLQWSLWYALGTCGFFQIISYIQVLWNTIEEREIVWNGAVEALVTLLSAVVTLFAEKIHTKVFSKTSTLTSLTILTALTGFTILLGTKTDSLYVSYLGYTLFCTLYAFTITICSAEVAKRLADDTFGLIFGINTLVALIMQSILTFIVISETIFTFDVKTQFIIYAWFYFIFAILYFLNIVYDIMKSKNN